MELFYKSSVLKDKGRLEVGVIIQVWDRGIPFWYWNKTDYLDSGSGYMKLYM